MCLGILISWIDFQSFLKIPYGFWILFQIKERNAYVIPRYFIQRTQLDCFLKIRHRFWIVSLALHDDSSHIQISPLTARIDFNSLLEMIVRFAVFLAPLR